MDYNEKVKYIIKDYTENVIDKVGINDGSEKWFERYLNTQSEFIKKYDQNSMSKFAKRISLAYGEVVDASMRVSNNPKCS